MHGQSITITVYSLISDVLKCALLASLCLAHLDSYMESNAGTLL